jgi:hypothetical protein
MLRLRGGLRSQTHAAGSDIVTIFDPGAETKGLMHRTDVQKSISCVLKRSDILDKEFVYGVGREIWMWA